MKPNKIGILLMMGLSLTISSVCLAGGNMANVEVLDDDRFGQPPENVDFKMSANIVLSPMDYQFDVALVSDNSFFVPKVDFRVSDESHKGFGLFATPLFRLARDGISCR